MTNIFTKHVHIQPPVFAKLLAIICCIALTTSPVSVLADHLKIPATNPAHSVVEGCPPISMLPCENIQVALPFSLTFNGSVPNTLAERSGLGTGFTMVNMYSGIRLPEDGQPVTADVPAYVPANIWLGGGRLILKSNKGLAHKTENNQLNSVGVKVDTRGKISIETTMINPATGADSQQGGIWFGLNDKTFLKLVATSYKIQLRREVSDVSSTTPGTANPDERITPIISGLASKTVRIRLIIDPLANTAEGFYSTDGGVTYTSTGNGYPVKTLNIAGTGLTGSTAYAGLFTSHRNSSSAITYSFDNFSIIPVNDACLPVSTLPCTGLLVNLPYSLNFDAPAPNSLADKNGAGTGFTLADTYTGVRLSQDGQAENIGIPGYQPSKLTLTGGRLQLVTNKGVSYLAENNQINVLGVKTDSRGKLQIETTIINPFYGTQSQQAGIWFGLGEKTNIKLVVTGNKVQMRREVNDVSANGPETSNPDLRITPVISGLNTRTVRLRLIIDPANNTAEGFYSTDGVTYQNAGRTYPVKTLSIAGMGITASTAYAGISASHRNGTQAVTYTFDEFKLTSLSAPVLSSLQFSPEVLNFTVLKNGEVPAQSVNLSAEQGSPVVSFGSSTAAWLSLPGAATGNITFGEENINTDLPAGRYHATVTASADGYESATLLINLTVVEPLAAQEIKINFQDPATVPPAGWLNDYGQSYGSRTGQYQGTGLYYGWKRRSDNSLLDLSAGGTTPGNGRNRGTPASNLLRATLMHMQADDLSNFNGTPIEGYWEAKVLNGEYDVSVTVGDGQVNTSPETHFINAEGISIVSGFVPTGARGSSTRFRSATQRITVADGLLTINADGGTNTKINSAQIVPVSIAPYLYWSESKQNLLIESGTTTVSSFTLGLNNSSNTHTPDLNYTITATYGPGGNNWLSFNSTHNSASSSLAFNYTAAKDLPLGTYTAIVKAEAPGYSTSETEIIVSVVDANKPYVISSIPAHGDNNVSVNTVSIAANNLHVPEVPGYKGGVDNSTITNSTVQVLKVTGNTSTPIMGVVQGTGGGDAISFSPTYALEPNTVYKFTVTDGVKSFSGASFIPYEAIFTTGAADTSVNNTLNVEFTKVPIPGTQNKKYTSLTFGPDGKLYALTIEGAIERYTVNPADGSLSGQQIINTLINKYGARTAIGLAFGPQSTPDNLIAWVTHSSSGITSAPNFDGNISMLSGYNLENEQLMVTQLPRSTKDHLTNSLAFGPDGALYVSQGSNSSMGDYDASWKRNESLLAGSILRLDLQKLSAVTLPLNVRTTSDKAVINSASDNSMLMSNGTYNPYSTVSPLTIYASGVRNAYDLLWHTNGQLYVPANGSGGAGNTPASITGTRRPDGTLYSGPAIPATTGTPVQNDWLFRINPLKPVGYYGHPNPLRGEYVANRGFNDNPLYPADVIPDVNYRPAAFNFQQNKSPNGAIEYKSNTFGGALKGKILVCRFSGGGDIMVLKPGALLQDSSVNSPTANDGIYDITESTTGSGTNGLVGMSGFANPLDMVEDVNTGNLYISEFNWNNSPSLTSQITLLKVKDSTYATAALSTVSPKKLVYSTVINEAIANNQTVTIANVGTGALKVTGLQLAGKDADQFNINGARSPDESQPIIVSQNSSVSFNISFDPVSLGTKTAVLRVIAEDNPAQEVSLNGTGSSFDGDITDKLGYGDMPSLNSEKLGDLTKNQKIMRVYPNPNLGDKVYVDLKNFARREPVEISVYDESGRLVQKVSKISNDEGMINTEIPLNSRISPGLYIITATALSGNKQAKLIVQ